MKKQSGIKASLCRVGVRSAFMPNVSAGMAQIISFPSIAGYGASVLW